MGSCSGTGFQPVNVSFRILLGCIALSAAGPFTLRAQTTCNNVPAYSPCEIVFELSDADAASHPDPYSGVTLQGEFRSPRHRTFVTPAFADGGRRLVIRFAPTEAGQWDYLINSNIAAWEGKTGTFTASASDVPGFVRPANVHHWAYTERTASGIERAHLWMGASGTGLASLDDAAFRSVADARAAQKFNHLSLQVLGAGAEAGFTGPGQPDLARFRRLDERIHYLNQKGLVADVILAAEPGTLVKAFPTWEDRRRFVRYMVARYGAFNVTWQLVERFEDYAEGRSLLKEIGAVLKEADAYQHPLTTGAGITSAPLLEDKWMSFAAQGIADDTVGAVEHQLYAVPFVNLNLGREGGDVDTAGLRRRLWNATMDGQYVTYGSAATQPPNSPGAKQMTVWFDILSDTRHWELEPYFDIDGGRALALEGVEYLAYIEKPGPLELRVEKHGYDALWINPADGEITRKKFSGDHFTGEPPDKSHDWVLHLVREGRVESMNRSYKFESREIVLQEVEQSPEKVPFTIEQPASAADIAAGKPVGYSAKVTRDTRATRSMMWLWTGEVAADGRGYRVLGTGSQGNFAVPASLAKNYPAVLNLRLYGMNGNGKVYALDRALQINR
jgi:Domain of unknown function (DUF5060)/Protein of unknown function (DUF4038)